MTTAEILLACIFVIIALAIILLGIDILFLRAQNQYLQSLIHDHVERCQAADDEEDWA